MSAPRFTSEAEAVTYIFRSMRKLRGHDRGPDEKSRDTTPTVRLLARCSLLNMRREYGVVTGSKGKGSTTAISAKLLQALGHTTGMISSPHLVSWRERIRVNGRAIPEPDFCRILGELAPEIDAIEETLGPMQIFSPQGLFLAVALRWFDENHVSAAILEVGRGGRFDDIAVVPNMLSLFTPIMLEHRAQLGPTLERIAWHKAGIIKAGSYACSVAQAPEVLRVLQAEAEALGAEFTWLAPMDMAQVRGQTAHGLRIALGRYGDDIDLPLMGEFQAGNATLAVQGVGNMHGRLAGIPHGSQAYVQAIRRGLETVVWPGRVHKLSETPQVFVDGAINAESAQSLARSLNGRLTAPVIAVVGVPEDKDYAGVYREIGPLADTLILTETGRNPSLSFPAAEGALALAQRSCRDVRFAGDLDAALAQAHALAGRHGSIVIVGTQSIVADSMQHYGMRFEQI